MSAAWHALVVGGSGRLEITDLLIDIDSRGVRRPVGRDAVVNEAITQGDRWAARLLANLPERDGYLDEDYVDRLVVAIHCEIQRLSEEFRHGARMWSHLEPIVESLRLSGIPAPYRVVDVGCGAGYVVRWLAANAAQADVELVGVDLNPALVDAANELAERDGVDCRFEAADAFSLNEPATVLISTGVLHHFSVDDVGRFFAAHEASDATAFVHVDFQRSLIAPFGAWLFHQTRMRLAISRHDGIRSAQRAHPIDVLARAAIHDAPRFQSWISGRRVRHTPLPCVLNSIVGVDRRIADAYLGQRRRRSARLEPLG